MTKKYNNSYPNFPTITTHQNSTIKHVKLTKLTSMDIRLPNSSQLIARVRSKALQKSLITHSLLFPLKSLHSHTHIHKNN